MESDVERAILKNGLPTFFTKSNTTDKEWAVKILDKDGRKFTITKVGAKCDICSERMKQPVYKSVRVLYEKFKDKDGSERTEFSWINSRCFCCHVVVYKNGKVIFRPAEWYSGSLRVFDDLKNIPSDFELHYKP
jgi:hypothetical protein